MGIFRKEEKKVRETIEMYASGLADKDIEMLMSLVALDEDFLMINQDPYEKIIGAKKFYIKTKEFLKSTDNIDIKIDWMFLSVIEVAAWVNCEMLFIIQRGNYVTEEKRSITFILEKRRGDWYIVHIINSVDPSAVKEADEAGNEVSEDTEIYEPEGRGEKDPETAEAAAEQYARRGADELD